MFTCGVKAYRLGQKLDRLNFPISLQPFRKNITNLITVLLGFLRIKIRLQSLNRPIFSKLAQSHYIKKSQLLQV